MNQAEAKALWLLSEWLIARNQYIQESDTVKRLETAMASDALHKKCEKHLNSMSLDVLHKVLRRVEVLGQIYSSQIVLDMVAATIKSKA